MSYVFNPFTGNLDATAAGSATSPGGADTQIQFNDGGAFAGNAGLTFDKTLGKLTLSGVQLALSGNISATSWGLNGLKIQGGTSTLTDTSAAGTVATGATNVLGGNTIAASNARTITNYYSTYINDPIAGTNVTLTNKWSLGLEGGITVGAGNASLTGEATNVALLKAGNANVRTNSSGAMWLEVTGQTAGNARGAGAFDWQAGRTNAAHVASGANAVAMGTGCTASSTYALAIGAASTASGTSAIALGSQATASGSYSTCLGYRNTASGYFSTAVGHALLATNRGQFSFGVGVVGDVATGKAQGNLQTFLLDTTDAVSTPLRTDYSDVSHRMVIPATRSVAFRGIVQAMCNVSSSSNFIKAWTIEGVITRDGSNNTRIVGTPTITVIAADTDGTPTPSTWAIASITADDTNEALAINVTGQAGTTIRWQATLMYSQVGF